MTDREIMQQALEALTTYDGTNGESKRKRVLAALRERLAQPEQDPRRWEDQETCHCDSPTWCKHYNKCNRKMLGLPPAPREWKSLTQREIDELWDLHHDDYGNALSATGYERAIEAKLREKNHG